MAVKTDAPKIARVKDFRIDSDYSSWLSDVIKRYRTAQIKAALKVNIEKLQFNWSVGRDLVVRKAEENWGSGVVEQLSLDLQNAFPAEKGFSSRNVWRMKQWYLFFSTPEASEKLSQVGAELQNKENQSSVKLPQVGAEIDGDGLPEILGLVPWRHQTDIVAANHWTRLFSILKRV